MAEATTSRRRFELLDALIATRLADAPTPDPAVAWAYRWLTASQGRIRIGPPVKEC